MKALRLVVPLVALTRSSTEGFTTAPRCRSRSSSNTELYKYRPTKWTPQHGATGSATSSAPVSPWGAPPAPPAASTTSSSSGPSMADLAKEWAARNADDATPAAAPAAPPVTPPPPPPPPGAAAVASVPQKKKNYAVTRWSPQTGSHPHSEEAWTPEAAAAFSVTKWPGSSGGAPQEWDPHTEDSSSSGSAPPPPPPTMDDLAAEWAARNRSPQ